MFGLDLKTNSKTRSFFFPLFLQLSTTVLDMQTMPPVVFRLLRYIKNPPRVSVVSEGLFTL